MRVSEMNKLTAHYDRYFMQKDAVVLHPTEGKYHIDALLYKPTERYPFWKLASMGASDYKMNGNNSLGNRNEYMMFIDSSVNMEDKDTASWYYQKLLQVALYPVLENEFISYGHSIELEKSDDSDIVCAYLEMPQAIHDTGILRCKTAWTKKAICLQIILLNQGEMEHLLEIGGEEFSYTYTYPEGDAEGHYLCKK